MKEELMIRVLLGKASEEEARQVAEWLATDPAYQAIFDQLSRSLQQASAQKYDTATGLEKLKNRLQQEKSAESDSSFIYYRPTYKQIFRLAASVLVLLGVGWLGFVWYWAYASHKPSVAMMEIKTMRGQRKQVTLPDGSQLWLSAASKIRFPRSFQGNKREVFMDGEIFFKVSHNKEKPFIIHTDTLQVQVLGTSFVVRSYLNHPKTTVTVATGKVAVSLAGASHKMATLTASQSLVFHKNTQQASVTSELNVVESRWKEGSLVFDKLTFAEIATELERYYDVKIVFATPKLAQCVFKATFKPMHLEQILQVLQQTKSFHYEYNRQNKKVILSGKGC
ncbi:FecR domain-containing protein [Xanthocytophaga flava]|uniref:FecR domain-containing protein n=1 Tax=Xanthocytophaga flava TaxID=3048013 RepID=UPI0028D26264|nr:FecR domain-containing protein [Xanthocytophaga flavus]MDJ1470763.1 FecR domain-containing protein [Xanthocytophaga flavus]